MKHLFTSESVSEGHPDKICDQISDAVLDDVLRAEPQARVACESFVTTGLALVGGEVSTRKHYIDTQKIARDVIKEIGYTQAGIGFDADSCSVLSAIHQQSGDIAMGVDTGGAGDQGMMFGYANSETKELMPLPIMLAHGIVRKLADIRKSRSKVMPYLRPDAKSQVTVEYDGKRPVRVHTIVVSTQHAPKVSQKRIKDDVIRLVVPKVVPKHLIDAKTRFYVNPTGRFVVGGPHGDSGLTGRKIIVDTYGGRAPHGGGAFSGKDPTKVDRSAAYAARHLAKNIVAANLASECQIQLSYAIGVREPISVFAQTFGTGIMPDVMLEELLMELTRSGGPADMTPRGIIKRLKLQRPIFRKTAAYGHFGREEKDFSWEKRDLVPMLKKAIR